jgi:hypothetical protein
MNRWPRYPTLYEIHTWAWLNEMSRRQGRAIDLGTVPQAEWDRIEGYGFDAVWLMGVWERSPAAIAIANGNAGLIEEFRRTLPDFEPADNVGSPYAIRRYEPDAHLGGAEGLAAARRELAARGIRLILDFVPNHVAPDHPWTVEHPEYFIRGDAGDLAREPESFAGVGGQVFACGRDPYFPAWRDVLQLNAFDAGLRQAAGETLAAIAAQCDGVRCDMAMLALSSIFERTWADRAGTTPKTEYWAETIPEARRAAPHFLFLAEAYWDREWELQQLGFDFCYDKRLYDRLAHEGAESVRQHLHAEASYQNRLARFLENHDEPRAAAAFAPAARERAAALATYTAPGARLFHEGQLEGRRVRLPVFLGRRPEEPVDEELRQFYAELLAATDRPLFREGRWSLCETSGWPDNPSFRNILAWTWTGGEERFLIAVNWSDRPAQARIHPVPADFVLGAVDFTDRLSGASYRYPASELLASGLYVELAPWGYHFFDCHVEARQAMLAQA